MDFDSDVVDDSTSAIAAEHGSFVERMLDVLRHSSKVQIAGGKSITLRNVKPPARALALSAEALVGDNGDAKPVALTFGPENGAVSEKLVLNAAREANARNYTHLYIVGFAIQPTAREMIESPDVALGIPATYMQMTPDLMMGDLLKNLRSSQIFSVCGLPDVEVVKAKKQDRNDPQRYVVRLAGLDIFDPVTNEVDELAGSDVPCWMLDTEYTVSESGRARSDGSFPNPPVAVTRVWWYIAKYGHTEDQSDILPGSRHGPDAGPPGTEMGGLEIRSTAAPDSCVRREGSTAEGPRRHRRPLAGIARPDGGRCGGVGSPRARRTPRELATSRVLASCDSPRHELPHSRRRTGYAGRPRGSALARPRGNPACVIDCLDGVPLRARVIAGRRRHGRSARGARSVRGSRRDAGRTIVQRVRTATWFPTGLHDRGSGDPVRRIARHEQRARFSKVRRLRIDDRAPVTPSSARGRP